MLWLVATSASYFFGGVTSVLAKIILKDHIREPLVYSFYSGILGIFVLFLTPFGFKPISMPLFIFSFVAGAAFIMFLLLIFESIKENDVSRTISIVGAASSLLILIFSSLWLKDFLYTKQYIAFLLFILGGIIISFEEKRGLIQFRRHLVITSLGAALFLAISLTTTKFIFESLSFINGFIWIRLGGFIFSLLFVFHSRLRQIIINSIKTTRPASGALFMANKITGALSGLLLNYAIFLGPVALINSLRGLEYFFVFLLSLLISAFYPKIFKESWTKYNFISKFAGIIIIGIGFVFLA